jgi:EF hand domain-containing protein
MQKRTNVMLLVLLVVALLALGATKAASFRQDTASVPKPQDNLGIGEDDARQLMLLIGMNKDGKVTKEAWMKFMAAEFDRLDKDKSGTLDVKELAESRLHVSPFSSVGK